MFVDSPPSTNVRKKIPAYPTQLKNNELRSLKQIKIDKRLNYLRYQLGTMVDKSKAKDSVREIVEKITKDAILAFRNSKLPAAKENWQFKIGRAHV